MRIRPLLIALCALASLTVIAQVRYRPTETGPQGPWSFTVIDSVRQSRGATAAEVPAVQTRLQELAAIVKRAPPSASPAIGFAGELSGRLSSYDSSTGQPLGKSVPLGGILLFGAFPLIEFERGAKIVNEDLKDGETQLLQFIVNDISGWGENDHSINPAFMPPMPLWIVDVKPVLGRAPPRALADEADSCQHHPTLLVRGRPRQGRNMAAGNSPS